MSWRDRSQMGCCSALGSPGPGGRLCYALASMPDKVASITKDLQWWGLQPVSQSRASIRAAIAALTWVFKIVPDDHERAAELLVRRVQEAGVIGLGKALALVFAGAASSMDPVDQPGPAAPA